MPVLTPTHGRPQLPPDATEPTPQTHDTRGVGALVELVGGGPVPLVGGGEVPYVNLDGAASTPPLAAVAEHVARVLPHYASVHRGAGYASRVSTALYERTRATVAAFVGARADDVVVVTRNTTDALNLLAAATPG